MTRTFDHTAKALCVPIRIIDDSIHEDTEKFEVHITSLEPSVMATRADLMVSILDDDEATVSFSDFPRIIEEGSKFNICVQLKNAIAKQIPYIINVSLSQRK